MIVSTCYCINIIPRNILADTRDVLDEMLRGCRAYLIGRPAVGTESRFWLKLFPVPIS